MNPWWSWGLSAGALLCTFLIARKRREGWVVGFLLQGAWITYAIISEQWGFLASATAFAILNAYGWVSWGRAPAKSTCDCQ